MLRTLVEVLLLLGTASAAIDHTSIRADTRRLIPYSDAFGYARFGVLEIELRDIRVYTLPKASSAFSQPLGIDYDKLGFFVARAEDDVKLEQQDTQKICALHTSNEEDQPGFVLFRFSDGDVQRHIQANGNSVLVTKKFNFTSGGLIRLYFANCEPDKPVSFKARIAMYNPDTHGRKSYLSIGLTALPTVYLVMFALFYSATAAWGWLLVKAKSHTHKIHVMMLALGFFQALTLLCRSAEYHYIGKTGHPGGWNIAFYIFTAFRGLFFFTFVVLMAGYMKPFLGDHGRRILLVVIPLQVLVSIASIVAAEQSPALQGWALWRGVFYLVDSICCCAVLFPIIWSIKHLREAARQRDGKASCSVEKLTFVRRFVVMLVAYIYFTRIMLHLLEVGTVQFEYLWISAAASELATLAFYVWTAVHLRPHQDNPYLELHQEELEVPWLHQDDSDLKVQQQEQIGSP